MQWLARRDRQLEMMDAPGADPELLRKSLRYLRRINWLLGYTRGTIAQLETFSRRWQQGGTVRLLDVATGSGDVPRAVLDWADRRGWRVQIIGIDRHATTAAVAAQDGGDRRFQVARADALTLPFADDTFDYALCSLFLHHLSEEDAVTTLREMVRVSRRGIIVADLLRHRRAYAWISLFTLFANPMAKNDARASVAQAFTREEVLALQKSAGADFARYHRQFGHRFTLAGEKPV